MKTCNRLIMVLMCGVLAQCDEPNYHKIREYLPLQDGTQWNYLITYNSTADSSIISADTFKLAVKGDTLLNGLRYVKVVDNFNNLAKVIRKEGNKYYGMNHELYGGFSSEYLFLDDDATENTSWTYHKTAPSNLNTEYKVIAFDATRTYNGITYQHVMEIEVNYYAGDGGGLMYSTRHSYARGIGEIYTFYPYPSYSYADVNISLIK